MIFFTNWETSQLRRFPAQTLMQPLNRGPIMDHKSHFTIQGSAPGYKWAAERPPAGTSGFAGELVSVRPSVD
jgi:hypothetical protein